MLNYVYRYDDVIPLLYDDSGLSYCPSTDNRPMRSDLIKLHKGVENTLFFKSMDHDRKPVGIEDIEVIGVIVDPVTKQRMHQSVCRHTADKGVFTFSLSEADMQRIPEGHYTLYVKGERTIFHTDVGEDAIIKQPFYTNTSSDITFNVEVSGSADSQPTETIDTGTLSPLDHGQWQQETDDKYNVWYLSSPIQSNKLRNSNSGLQTLAIMCNEFIGSVELQGTLDHVPSMDESNSWFNLSFGEFKQTVEYGHYDGEEEEWIGFTGVDPFTFQSQAMWVRIKVTPNMNTPLLDEPDSAVVLRERNWGSLRIQYRS